MTTAPLADDTTVGRFRISSRIARGGMGEVYKAYDGALDRYVALKILPPELVDRPDRVHRFVQEAKSASALSHPHIVTVYEIGHDTVDGRPIHYIAMELLEGATLREEIHGKRAPLKRLVDLLAQVADGLAKAHAAGIVHRDLKPDNIMVTGDGYAKVLDFGLAKLVEPRVWASTDGTGLPTTPRTREGVVLGTIGYMAPEQVEGKPADHRSDIFSFGCVLYEAATRSGPFEADSEVDVLHKILHHDPPMEDAPAQLQRIIRRCLAKDPGERYQSIKDVGADLAEAFAGKTQPVQHRKSWTAAAAAAAFIVVALLIIYLRPIARTAAPGGELQQLSIALPSDNGVTDGEAVAISPDGKRIVYSGRGAQLFIRDLDRLEITPIPDTKLAGSVFFSPDGKWVGFNAGGKLNKVRLAGGSVETICDAPALRGADWGHDGTIVFSPASSAGLFLVSSDGGTPHELTRLDPKTGETSHRWPQFLPDGKHVLFTVMSSADFRIATIPTRGGAITTLVKGGSTGLYLPTGHLLYARGETIFATPFDPKQIELRGEELPLLRNVAVNPLAANAFIRVSRSGAIVYLPHEKESNNRQLVMFDRHGIERPVSSERRPFLTDFGTSLSPDGHRLVVGIGEPRSDLWLYDMVRDTWTQLTSEGNNLYAIWTPNGKSLIYTSTENAQYKIYKVAADGSGSPALLYRGTFSFPDSVSPDGKILLFENKRAERTATVDIWLLSLSKGEATPLIATESDEDNAVFSPDGKWLVYRSNRVGKGPPDLYVEPFPRTGERWPIASGAFAFWSRQGRELIYLSKGKVMAADVKMTPRFSVGKPHVLFDEPYRDFTFNISPDGERFFAVKPDPLEGQHLRLNVVLGDLTQLLRPRA